MRTGFRKGLIAIAVMLGAVLLWTAPTRAAEPIPPHAGRNGPLTPREMAMAKAAWSYFVGATQPATGLANSVSTYPSTTMWDTASYISALVSARELGIIDKHEFDNRTFPLLATLQKLDLFRGELPNKVYDTRNGAKVNYANKPGEVGYSALDIGRMLIWLKILKERYPYLANSVDGVVLRWNFCHVLTAGGTLQGAGVGKDGATQYFQEGRLGYEEYAAKAFALWGFKTTEAASADPLGWIEIYGIRIPFDARDPRVTKTMNYVLSEAYILDGLELNFDLPGDDITPPIVHSDGWNAEFGTRVMMVQQRRFEATGILTARTEHQVEGPPYFVYDTVFAHGYAWNTLDPDGNYVPERAAVAIKAAIGMWALWATPYTDKLFNAVAELYTDKGGFYEGLYENGKGTIPLQTANNNGIILAALLYKVQGPILKIANRDPQVWTDDKADPGAAARACRPQAREALLCPATAPIQKADYRFCRPVDGPMAAALRKLAGPLAIAVRDCGPPVQASSRPKPKPAPRPASCCPQPGAACSCPPAGAPSK